MLQLLRVLYIYIYIYTLIALDLLKQMLEAEPSKRIKAEDALKHEYLSPVMMNFDSQLDDNFDDLDDHSDLNNRINKINEE